MKILVELVMDPAVLLLLQLDIVLVTTESDSG